MKIDLRDVTFLIAIRLDSLQRIENIKFITEQLCTYFDTNIMVLEAAYMNNGILKSILPKKVYYQFIEDKDPVFHRTKYFNSMTEQVKTQYLSLWDADVVIDKKAIHNCVEHLRTQGADIAYPYDGRFFETPEMIRNLFFRKKDIRILYRHIDKMNLLYEKTILYGGAVIMNKNKFIEAGMENERHYGWGNDDFDRYHRFVIFGFNIYRADACLFHLPHPRGNNSQYRSLFSKNISMSEAFLIENSSKDELLASQLFY